MRVIDFSDSFETASSPVDEAFTSFSILTTAGVAAKITASVDDALTQLYGGTGAGGAFVSVNGPTHADPNDVKIISGSHTVYFFDDSTAAIQYGHNSSYVHTFNGDVSIVGEVGFNGAGAQPKPAITGSRAANAALASLLTELATLGLVTDSTVV